MELLKSNVVTAFENTATYFYFPESTEGGLDADDSFGVGSVSLSVSEASSLKPVDLR